MRSDSEQGGSFVAGRAQAAHVRVLQVTNAAVNHLEALGRGGAAEISAIDDRCAQSAQRCLTRCSGPERTAADDQKVELALGERMDVSLHDVEDRALFNRDLERMHILRRRDAGPGLLNE